MFRTHKNGINWLRKIQIQALLPSWIISAFHNVDFTKEKQQETETNSKNQ